MAEALPQRSVTLRKFMVNEKAEVVGRRRAPSTFPTDVRHLAWAAEQLGIGTSTAYRIAAAGKMPGAFKVGGQWRISVPRFLTLVHGSVEDLSDSGDERS